MAGRQESTMAARWLVGRCGWRRSDTDARVRRPRAAPGWTGGFGRRPAEDGGTPAMAAQAPTRACPRVRDGSVEGVGRVDADGSGSWAWAREGVGTSGKARARLDRRPRRPCTPSTMSSPLPWRPRSGEGEESEGVTAGRKWGTGFRGATIFLVFIQGGDQGLGFYHGEVSVTQLRG